MTHLAKDGEIWTGRRAAIEETWSQVTPVRLPVRVHAGILECAVTLSRDGRLGGG